MKVTRTSVLTGKIRTRDISYIKPDDLALYESGHVSLTDAMPYLNSSDREFILCGITTKEWKDAFSAQLQEIVNDKFTL